MDVHYSLQFSEIGSDWLKTINRNEIDNYPFSYRPFNEILLNPKFIRPYFDFDSVSNLLEFNEVINWLNSLQTVFGKYCLGGYTKNTDFAKETKLRFIKDAHHVISFHVTFFESQIESKLFIEIVKQKNHKFVHENINKFVDPNVYKLETRQIMRHPLSYKYVFPNSDKNCETRGNIVTNSTPKDFIITPIGTEKIITYEDIKDLFGLDKKDSHSKKKTEKTKETDDLEKFAREYLDELYKDEESHEESKEETQKEEFHEEPKKTIRRKNKDENSNKTIEDIDYNDNLIKFNAEELLEFIDILGIENNTNGILSSLAPLYNSPFDKDFLVETISEWYSFAQHDHPENVEKFIERYYKQEFSNRWFFSLLKKFGDEDIREYYLGLYSNHIDYSININNSNFTYEDIKEKLYKPNEINKLLSDLRGIIGNIDERWFLKINKEKQQFIIILSDEQLKQKTKTFKPFKNNTKINLYQVISKYSNVFRYRTAKMEKNNEDDNNINLFQGYKYEEIITTDFTIIQPFLDHIRNVICNNDIEKYNYLLKWFANIIQNITVKNGTIPIIIGEQGSGKSFVVELFCDLLGSYALCNVDDLDKVFGKFNGLIGRNILININEPPEANEKFGFLGKIKSKVTQKKTIQETKGVDQIEIESWCNYILTTNSYCPLKEERGNRRFIYFETNNKYCGNKEYFDNLIKPIQTQKQGEYNKEFMGIFLHYLLTEIDSNNFDAEELIRKINSKTDVNYNEQLERQYYDCNNVEKYVIDNFSDFIKGVDSDYIKYNMICQGHTQNSICRSLLNICDKKQKRIEKDRKWIYVLKPKEQIQSIWNIIEYKKHQSQLEE